MRPAFDRIHFDDIPPHFKLAGDVEKFSHWPVQFDLDAYHRDRLRHANQNQLFLLAGSSANVIESIFEVTFNAYDSNLFGIKSYTLSNIFIKEDISIQKKQLVLEDFYSYFRQFVEAEKINFCFTSINNFNTSSSRVAQKNGFRYMVTWGDCFYDKESTIELPAGYFIGNEKRESDLSAILDMSRNYFRGGRFYSDPMFNHALVDKMYEDLVLNAYNDPLCKFSVLYTSKNIPVGCFIYKPVSFQDVNVAALRFLVYNQTLSIKGLSTKFLIKTSDLLLKSASLVTSGIELHNLASLRIHVDAGYRFNNVHSAYHLWA